MKLADLFIKLGLQKDGFDKGLNDAKSKTNAFGSAVKKIGGMLAGVFAVGALKSFAKESLNLYNIQAQAEQQLLIALKGRKDAQRDLIRQAQYLQGLTLFGDEETIRAQALIAAFVKEENQIKKIIPLVQDLATAKMMSLSGAADLVSKTLGSSTNALSRYGIQVEGAVGSSERLESLMKGLNNAFGGQAEAAANVGTGGITQFKNAIGDLREEIGKLLVTSVDLNKFLSGVVRELRDAFYIITQFRTADQVDEINKLKESLDKMTESEFWDFYQGLSWEKSQAELKEVKAIWEDILSKRGLEGVIGPVSFDISAVEDSIPKFKEAEKTIRELEDDTTKLEDKLKNYTASQVKERESTIRQISANKKLIESLTTSNDEIEKSATKLQDMTDASWAAHDSIMQFFRDIKSESKGIEDIFDLNIQPNLAGAGAVADAANLASSLFGDEKIDEIPIDTQAVVNQINEFVSTINGALEGGIEGGISAIGEAIGEAFASGDWSNFGKEVLNVIGGFLKQIGSALIAYGIALEAFASGNPVLAIAAGTALVILGAAISSMAKAGPMGAGAGSYAGASSAGAGSASAAIAGDVKFVLEGDKLVGAIDNNKRRRTITS